jgi:hypothetical protein
MRSNAMRKKLDYRAVEMFRLPSHEIRGFVAGWASEAERLRLGANRPLPLGKQPSNSTK